LVQIVLGVVEPVALLVVGIDARELLVLGQDGCLGSSHYSCSIVGSTCGGRCRNVKSELPTGPPQIRTGPASDRRFCPAGQISVGQSLPAGTRASDSSSSDNGPMVDHTSS